MCKTVTFQQIFWMACLASTIDTMAFAPLSSAAWTRTTALSAEAGAPQYDKYQAVLTQAETVGEGSVMLHIGLKTDDTNTAEPLSYQPGNVLALEIQPTPEQKEHLNEKTLADTEKNEGWMRGPYTVSRATQDSLDIMIKVVGAKSKAMAEATPGTPLRFGGKFKVPIVEGIATATTKRLVLISTGVGVGPCLGALEQLWESQEHSKMSKVLIASYRNASEEAFGDILRAAAADSDKAFRYEPLITSESGRLSSKENMQLVFGEDAACAIQETHYHLIGNGQLVSEWKQGLGLAGVPEEHVTVESYFNHQAEPSQERIELIAETLEAGAREPTASTAR